MILLTVSKPKHVCNDCNITVNEVYYKIEICKECKEKIEVINALLYPIKEVLYFSTLKRENELVKEWNEQIEEESK